MNGSLRKISLYAMALLYISAGINHFINPGFYETILPPYIPFHSRCIVLSGICEIVFALLLLPEKPRGIAAWLIIAMLTVFFIIHVQMLVHYWPPGGIMRWIAVIRIPLQFVLIWWAYGHTKHLHQSSC